MIYRVENEVEMIARHFDILELVIQTEPIGIVKLSHETGYPHHKVRYSLRTLEDANLIMPTDHGAITTDRTTEFVDNLDTYIDTIRDTLDEIELKM